MTQIDILKSKLEAAHEEHEALKADLPRFHSLLTENEQEAERLRWEKAPLDDQTQAKGRVNVAREMLQQHQSDIQAAQGEVARLEGQLGRERILLRMVEHSKEAKAERSRIDQAFLRLAEELQRATSTISTAWAAENKARRAFAEEGRALVPKFQDISGSAHWSLSEREKEQVAALERGLIERGAELEAVKDATTGRFTFLDPYELREFPRDAVSVLLWEAIRLLTEGDSEAHNLRRLTPTRANPSAHFGTLLEAGGVAHG